MTLSVALVQVSLRLGRWLLPLVAVVLVSVTLAYAITGTVAANAPAAVERSTTSPSAESADLGPSADRPRCVPTDGSYVDTLILTESRKIDCGWAP